MYTTRPYVFYSIYGVLITIVFLYVLFPSETVKTYLIQRINRENSDLVMTIGRIKPVFPPGIKLTAIDLSFKEKSLMDMNRITFRPSYLSLFRKNQNASFTGNIYEGNFKGTAGPLAGQPASQMEINTDFSDIEIGQISFLQEVLERKMSGRLQGKMLYKGKGLNGTLSGNILLADSNIEVSTPVLNLENLSFEKIEADWVFENQMIQMKNGILTGDQVKGSFSGFIRIHTPFNKSNINLNGTFKPQPAFISVLTQSIPKGILPKTILSENGLTIRLSGSFEEPVYSIR